MNRLGVFPNLRTFAIFILLALLPAAPACNWFRDFDFTRGARMTGGNPELGRKKLAQYSCISCHVIPGVPKGEGKSAPSLANWSGRQTFLNTFPNTPENLGEMAGESFPSQAQYNNAEPQHRPEG
jgi:hypothetical protein